MKTLLSTLGGALGIIGAYAYLVWQWERWLLPIMIWCLSVLAVRILSPEKQPTTALLTLGRPDAWWGTWAGIATAFWITCGLLACLWVFVPCAVAVFRDAWTFDQAALDRFKSGPEFRLVGAYICIVLCPAPFAMLGDHINPHKRRSLVA